MYLHIFLLGLAVVSGQECGLSFVDGDVDSSIVGGNASKHGKWPWQVSIHVKDRKDEFYHTCGGTLIDSQWVLTATHCFDKIIGEADERDYKIILGAYNISDDSESTRQTYGVSNIVNHEWFDRITFENDITLLKLDQEAIYTNFVQPACLPFLRDGKAGEEVWITGWGDQNYKPAAVAGYDARLQELQATIIHSDTCNQAEWLNGEVYEDMFCASNIELGGDSCQGDSGGPVILEEIQANDVIISYVIGITSWGYGCGEATKPGVYTRVFSYLNWIEEKMNTY